MRYLLFIAALFITPGLYAQAPNIEWEKSLGGREREMAYCIRQTTDGGYIVAGQSQSNNADVSGHHGLTNYWDYWIVKLDAAGNIQWEKSLGGINNDYAYSIQQTLDGGYIVAGTSSSKDGDVSGNHGGSDYWIVKLDATGNIQWEKSLGGSQEDYGYAIQQTLDGGYIVGGSTASSDGDVSENHGNFDYWIVKLDAAGNIQWQKSLGGSGEDIVRSIKQTTDGGYIVAGFSDSNDGDVSGNHGGRDCWIVKLDDTGNIQWQKSLGGYRDDEAQSIQLTTDGGYVVAASSRSNDGDVSGHHGSTTFFDYWVVKLDDTGNIQWQKSLGGSNPEYAYSIQQTLDGGYIVGGYTMSSDGDVTGLHYAIDMWVVKLTTDGAIQWQKTLGGNKDDRAFSIRQTNDGGYIVAGFSDSTDGDVSEKHELTDYWIVKLFGECPDLSSAPDNVGIVNSVCGAGCSVSDGSIEAPSGGCPAGSTLQYSTDNGETWSVTIPLYNHSGPAQTIITRCNCDNDSSQSSPSSSGVTTVPGSCTPPTPAAGSNSPVCAETELILTASGGTSYSWSGPGGFTSTQQNPTITNATATMAGTYTVTVTDENGCNGIDSINVDVNEEIFSSIIRLEDSLVVEVTGGTAPYSYFWSDGSTQNSTTISGNGTYSVTITDAVGCQKEVEMEITVSTSSIAGQKLSIFPNPTTNMVEIELPMNLGEGHLILYNQRGQEVMNLKRDFNTSFNQDISNLVPGVYIVRILTGTGVFVGKIVKR